MKIQHLILALMALFLLSKLVDHLPTFIVLGGADPEERDIEILQRSAAPGDIVIGGDLKGLADVARRLKATTASPDEPTLYNRSLHVAIIDSYPSVETGRKAPVIDIDVDHAEKAAILVISPGPAIFRIANATLEQRAKVAFEGPSPFEIENGPERILAGFRIGAFGAEDFTSPRDYLENHGPDRTRRFCNAMERWAKLFDVSPRQMRIFVYKAPQRISVNEEFLGGSPQPKSPLSWTVGQECRAVYPDWGTRK